MSARFSFLVVIVLMVTAKSGAQMRIPSYLGLCNYESDCQKVGKYNYYSKTLEPVRPNAKLLEFYRPLRGLIIQIANEYQIDPVALVAAPLAENTMNVKIKDAVEDALVLEGQTTDDGAPSGALSLIYNKPMSIGPGQIYVGVAKHVEPLAAQIEKRPIREKKEIKAALMTREGSLRYAAAIMRDAQNVYAQGGVDISRRPEILTTLYNIGRPAERLAGSQRAKQIPLPNYFGYFVAMNYRFIQQNLNLPSVLDRAP